MFTNKHVVVALIVAPILSVLAWFAVGSWIGEEPRAAQSGNSYPLLADSNCRWPSGQCDLENEDFSLSMRLVADTQLELESAHTLDGVLLAIGGDVQQGSPRAMSARGTAGLSWELTLDAPLRPGDRIKLVASAGGRQFFGDAATVFATADDSAISVFDR